SLLQSDFHLRSEARSNLSQRSKGSTFHRCSQIRCRRVQSASLDQRCHHQRYILSPYLLLYLGFVLHVVFYLLFFFFFGIS
ncbi:hypothetical protein CFP56_031310, partial [Quercus suber]